MLPSTAAVMSKAAKRPATYDDVLAAPEHKVAEIIEGELVLSPRPALPHAQATSALMSELGPPFHRARGGPGGWIILIEPELHLGADVLVPDLAGWRRETLSAIPAAPFLTVRPDWVCEVLSPATERYDRGAKVRLYAQSGVTHAWLVNPLQHTLEVLRLSAAKPAEWTSLSVVTDDAKFRAEPFEALELDLSVLWQDVQATEPRG
jgi:Uma2 family endonuclease